MGSSYFEKLKGKKIVPGINAYQAEREEKEQKNHEQKSSDTKLRMELQQKIIKPLAEQGLDVKEIVEILKALDEYAPLEKYFISYAENQVKKVQKEKNKNRDDDEER